MPNPDTVDFRDPKVIWDEEDDKWVMALAEGTKIGFYESQNLKEWRYTSSFQTENIGIIECPDLFKMRADDGTYKWVLGASANGKGAGKPNTYAYWTGSFNGNEFTADEAEPQWLDHGFDWYAGVTFEDGETDDSYEKRYALAWMNNWDYANRTRHGKTALTEPIRSSGKFSLNIKAEINTALPLIQSINWMN